MNIAVKVESRQANDTRYIDHIDFYVFIDGVCDGNMYRKSKNEKSFKKLYGFAGYGKAVRGKKRNVVEMLLKQLEEVELPFAMAII